MAKKNKVVKPSARLPKGFPDTEAGDIRAMSGMIAKIREVYESYGFEPLETPAFEYTDALGKFLPDSDRPNEGVFSLQDEDGQWLSLRYDLTAPLARYVAQNFQHLPKPFRRYATGTVWRNEKPGPGRFRQFTQFDADTVGTANIAADAEICMLAADTLEALGIERGQYVIKVNNRKVLDGLLECAGLDLSGSGTESQRSAVLRSLDKLDKFPLEEVALLLGPGRKDESGDFTSGAGLNEDAIELIIDFVHRATTAWSVVGEKSPPTDDELHEETGDLPTFLDLQQTLLFWRDRLSGSPIGLEGVSELEQMLQLWQSAGYGSNRILIDPSVVRGLDYYTGPVFEADLTFQVKNEDGQTVRFGSVGGGGRYDDLVARFTGQKVPATGFSIGVSRLQAALAALGRSASAATLGPVVVLVMDRERIADYQKLTQELRSNGMRAEMYVGTKKDIPSQMKYADKRGAPCVVIQGGDERERGEVQIKDLIEGAKAAETITDRQEWKEARPAQFSVPAEGMVEAVKDVIARHSNQ